MNSKEYVSRLDGLGEDARQDVVTLLQDVRDKYEKSLRLPQGVRGKYLEPNVTDHPFLSKDTGPGQGQKTEDDRNAILLSIPYFCMAPYVTEYPSHIPNLHPMRTLLQSSYTSTPKERDLQQAVCNLGYPKQGHCFHVPQIWCLILGDGACRLCSQDLGKADAARLIDHLHPLTSG